MGVALLYWVVEKGHCDMVTAKQRSVMREGARQKLEEARSHAVGL